MNSHTRHALIIHGDTPAGQAAVLAARERGYNTIAVHHGVKPAVSDDDLIFHLNTSDVADVESLSDNLERREIKTETVITCPRTVFSKNSRDLTLPFEEASQDSWEEILAGNLNAAMMFCRVFGSRMKARQRGRIVNLISNVALDPHYPNHFSPLYPSAAYVCAMAGLSALTRHLAAQYRNCGVLINNLVYGPLKESEPETLTSSYADRIPLEYMMTVNDLANSLDLLLDSNNNYMTGQSVVADGGVTIW